MGEEQDESQYYNNRAGVERCQKHFIGKEQNDSVLQSNL